MPSTPRKKPRRLDGRSLRYLGLLVGLCGLVYLGWKPASPALPVSPGPQNEAAKAPDRISLAVDSFTSKVSESWLEALWNADSVAVAQLLQQGFSATGPLDRRNTVPLHLLFFGTACQYGQSSRGVLPVLEHLLSAGAQVNVPDLKGNTPLMLAAAECGPEVVSRLLQAGADAAAKNALGLTAFELTLTNASEAGRVLTAHGFRLSPERYTHYQSIYNDEPKILKQLSLADPEKP